MLTGRLLLLTSGHCSQLYLLYGIFGLWRLKQWRPATAWSLSRFLIVELIKFHSQSVSVSPLCSVWLSNPGCVSRYSLCLCMLTWLKGPDVELTRCKMYMVGRGRMNFWSKSLESSASAAAAASFCFFNCCCHFSHKYFAALVHFCRTWSQLSTDVYVFYSGWKTLQGQALWESTA